MAAARYHSRSRCRHFAALRRVAAQAIAISGANSLEYTTVFVGALRADATVAPLPTSAAPEQLARMVADSGAVFFPTTAHLLSTRRCNASQSNSLAYKKSRAASVGTRFGQIDGNLKQKRWSNPPQSEVAPLFTASRERSQPGLRE
ncbi:AMP-binding protein [Bradyrhizobium sp. WU425]|uniref:AMP-binding protein n=1 Tax=Bradyrhizobium sp. WU425 TaxID=187029 RepID=UPI001E42DAF2|nr:AMP-binding protein [Bradyrhizobium canariense]UFW71409.1 AMP-binding protein [Bradyrhizobium canariense]